MNRWKKFVILLSIIGPGIITANVDNDAGGITTYSVAGAQFGYSLLWSLIPITVAIVIVQGMHSNSVEAYTLMGEAKVRRFINSYTKSV
jgi:Mn2+/Fe2+ NRAMP family transporter